MIDKRPGNEIKVVRTYAGSDIGSDCNPVVENWAEESSENKAEKT